MPELQMCASLFSLICSVYEYLNFDAFHQNGEFNFIFSNGTIISFFFMWVFACELKTVPFVLQELRHVIWNVLLQKCSLPGAWLIRNGINMRAIKLWHSVHLNLWFIVHLCFFYHLQKFPLFPFPITCLFHFLCIKKWMFLYEVQKYVHYE